MPRVCFTPNLQKLIEIHEYSVQGETVAAALDEVFARQPELRSYILDDQKRLRRHINIFLDGELARGTEPLKTPVGMDTEIYVMQALSGG
ncbi:MAG: thiamine biosynthesis protein ThiS [Planctomyces sp.]|nr:thiamine biosynthesis protein ThiS [Planctomyces sp.]